LTCAARWGRRRLVVTMPANNHQGAEPVSGARALLVFHSLLWTWWASVQFYYRVLMRRMPIDTAFWFGIVSWCLIATALVLFTRFARGRRGTPAAAFAQAAVVFALIDLIGETLQFAPQLGLPSVIPSDKSSTELLVRAVWVSCEFSLRISMFIALWRSQVGCNKFVRYAFLGLVLTQWASALLSSIPGNGHDPAWWTTQPVIPLLVRGSAALALMWLGLLICVNRRVARGGPTPS
jgi:hypothetical protein